MKIILAGYNIDKTLIEQLPNQNVATPETISAAYARISRSKKSVTKLRKQALSEVEKARESNQTIIFEMGHGSIAEHAVFNFDIIGISRYLVEKIERSRLVSFTEKSQRYVTLDGDYVVPEEIRGTELERDFSQVISEQNELYFSIFEKGKKYLENTGFEGSKRDLEGKAKEDARYVLALATETQLGMTVNARSLEKILRRLDKINLLEAAALKEMLETEVKKIAPSLIRYTVSDDYEKNENFLPELPRLSFPEKIELLEYSSEPEENIISALLFEKYGYDSIQIMNWVRNLTDKQKREIFARLFENMKSYHSVPRAFETAYFTFQIPMSASCFAQMKRHRMSTIISSNYHPQYGFVIPPLLEKMGFTADLEKVMGKTQQMYFKLEKHKKGLGNYILTNSHKLFVIFKANLRELYHFSRLRSDKHAQWEIREISQKIERLVKEKVPNAAMKMMGKSEF